MNKEDFKIIFMGTPDFAVESLKYLIDNNFNIVCVVTSPDKPAGRGQKISQSAVKKYALTKNIDILQPTNLKDSSFQQQLKNYNAELQVIVAFRMLPESIWNMPPLGSINLHASLLPQYRGAAPINWAVINGEKTTGVTTFFLKHEIDTGNILFQEKVEIEDNDNAGIVHDKLMITGAKLLVKTVQAIVDNNYKEIPQDNIDTGELKHAPKIFKSDCKIDWLQPIEKIHNLIRGLSPYPASWTTMKSKSGKEITAKIYDATIEKKSDNYPVGTIVTDKKRVLKIAVNGGFIVINTIQLAGKKRMPADTFLQGFQNITDYIME